MLYLKSDDGFGPDRHRAIAAIGRLVDDGVAAAINTRSSATIRRATIRTSTDL